MLNTFKVKLRSREYDLVFLIHCLIHRWIHLGEHFAVNIFFADWAQFFNSIQTELFAQHIPQIFFRVSPLLISFPSCSYEHVKKTCFMSHVFQLQECCAAWVVTYIIPLPQVFMWPWRSFHLISVTERKQMLGVWLFEGND